MFTDVDARGGELYPFKNLEAEPLGLKVSYTRQTTLVSRTVLDWDVCLACLGHDRYIKCSIGLCNFVCKIGKRGTENF